MPKMEPVRPSDFVLGSDSAKTQSLKAAGAAAGSAQQPEEEAKKPRRGSLSGLGLEPLETYS